MICPETKQFRCTTNIANVTIDMITISMIWDEFDEIVGECLPSDVAFMCYYGDFCPANSHFWYNGYGNLVSSDYPATDDESPFYINDIMQCIVDNDDDLGDEEIREILDNAKNSDDDDDDDEEEEEEE